MSPFWLGGIDNDLVQISTLDVLAIVKTTDSDGIGAVLEWQFDGCGQQDTLVCVLLVERVHIIFVTIDDDAADTANLPGAVDTVRLSHRLIAETHVINVLMIERDPLVLSSALDLEGDLAFVAIDASGDLAVAGKVSLLKESITSQVAING